MFKFRSVSLTSDGVRLLDQRELPHHTVFLDFRSFEEVSTAIRDMVVRGAPAIGLAAAYSLAHTARSVPESCLRTELFDQLGRAADCLKRSRPTAVNLAWAIERMMKHLQGLDKNAGIRTIGKAAVEEAERIAAEDITTNRAIGDFAFPLIPDGAHVIHHCNTGSLATVDYGTALGIIRIAHERGKKIHAFLDETRPRLQGAALSAWELKQYGIPHTVIVDSASGIVMRRNKIDCCLVGCDRVAANGDFANKIGTYNLALVAKAHGVPFYVAAPTSTIDRMTKSGDEIEIEERPAREVTHIGERQLTPDDTPVFNPAFDVTPASLVTAIITEKGVLRPPYSESISQILVGAN